MFSKLKIGNSLFFLYAIFLFIPFVVSKELLEADLVLEEAKADVVGLWALKYLIDRVSYFCSGNLLLVI